MIIIISGPGGVGKGTIVERLLNIDQQLRLSRSWTTRDRRPGEDPDAYTFVDETTFERAIEEGRFLEWNHFLGVAYYGSPKPEPTDKQDLLLEIDVHGARQVLEHIGASRSEPTRTSGGEGSGGGHVASEESGSERVASELLLIFIDAPSPEEQRSRLVGRGDSAEQVDRRVAAAAEETTLSYELPYVRVVNDGLDDAVAEVAAIINEHR